MIKLVTLRPLGDATLELGFSDGSSGHWSAATIIARATVMTVPLANPAYFDRGYFDRTFIEAGALAWPNGLELSPAALHRELDERGALSCRAA